MTFAPNCLSSALALAEKTKSDDELQSIKKKIRQKEAEFNKERAILIQQVELLKMQLNESSERESNLKKMNENIMNAFKNHEPSPCKPQAFEINEDHPKVAEILRQMKQECQHIIIKEKQRFRDLEYDLEKENQSLNYQVRDLTLQNEHLDKENQSKNQECSLLQTKYNEEMKYIDEKVKKEYEHTIKRLQNELETINSDIDRQVIQRLNEKLLTEQDFNETIIKYQKEQQIFLEEQKEFRKKVETQEKEIMIMEDKLRKAEDENGALKFKYKQNEKKLKEDIETIKKQKEDTVKRIELLEQSRKPISKQQPSSRQMTTTQAKSRNKPTIYQNKENVTGNNTKQSQPKQEAQLEDDELNKLRRQLSLYRCQIKKLEIELKDVKMQAKQEIAKLQDRLNVERRKRMNIYEDKIDKNASLLEDLLEKDQIIFQLNKQITKLQEQVQFANGANRSQTPNHLLSSLQESMVQNGFTQSMIDLNQNLFGQGGAGNNNSQKRLLQISPLRSLDLTLLNNNPLQNMSFTARTLKRCDKKKNSNRKRDQVMLSPKQIKRNRVNSVKGPADETRHKGNALTSSINGVLLKHSRDASIAEVNEDLYKDSVESDHADNTDYDDNKITKTSIILPFDKKVSNISRKQYSTASASGLQDDDLSQVLLHQQQSSQQQQDKPPRSDIYCDSLENESSDLDQQQQLQQQQQQDMYYSNKSKQSIPESIAHPRQLLLNLQKQKQQQQQQQEQQKEVKLKKKTNKLEKDEFEDDDCLVNILDHEDTNIEVQPTLTHTRQHLSTENLFKEISNTIDTLQSFRNLKQNYPQEKPKSMSGMPNALPKPYQTLQRTTVQKMMKLQDNLKQYEQYKSNITNQTQKPTANFGDNIMKSPSSPNIQQTIMHQQKQQSILQDSHSSHKEETRFTRVDSCPSPLDENETVVMLGSGEKLRVKEVKQSKLEIYQNQFKEQKNKFSATAKPTPQSNKIKQLYLTNHQPLQGLNSQNKLPQQEQQFGFRTRTNSLINSICQETSFKTKFMPSKEQFQQIVPVSSQNISQIQGGIGGGKGGHSRIPSMNVSMMSSQTLFSNHLSPKAFQ